MSDAELRALSREAEQADDAASWLRLAQAALRGGHGDEAGLAAQRARVRGADIRDVLDGLAPASLESFAMRELGARFELGKLWFTAWSPDAKTVYTVEGKKAVLALDASSGARRTIAALAGEATAFAASLDGSRLALGLVTPEGRKVVNQVATLDVASGQVETVGRGHAWIQQVALGEDFILCAEKGRVRGYRLDDREKSFLSLKGTAALDATGAFALTLGKDLSLHDPGQAKPRVTIGLDVPVHQLAVFHLACAGERLVIYAEDAVLLEKDGSVGARAKLPTNARVHELAAAPSGRHLAVFYFDNGQRTTRLDLVDLVAGKARSFDLGARPREASWSPSGQRLAIPTDQGTVVLIEAASVASPPPPAPAKPAVDAGWVELRSSARFWRVRREGALVEFHHGGLGTRGTRGATPCLDEADAKREMERRIAEKEKDGYRRV